MRQEEFVIVGFRFRNSNPECMYKGNITLQNEPTNIVDPNAIKVLIDNIHAGYVGKDYTAIVKTFMDKPYKLRISGVYPKSVKMIIEEIKN